MRHTVRPHYDLIQAALVLAINGLPCIPVTLPAKHVSGSPERGTASMFLYVTTMGAKMQMMGLS